MNSNSVNMDVWITQQAMAKETGFTVQCIHNWIKRGKIDSKRIKGSRLVLVDKTSVKPDLRKN